MWDPDVLVKALLKQALRIYGLPAAFLVLCLVYAWLR